MKHVSFVSSAARLFSRQLFAVVALISLVTMSVPPAVFAEDVVPDTTTPPTETVVTPPVDTTVTVPDTTEQVVIDSTTTEATSSDESNTTEPRTLAAPPVSIAPEFPQENAGQCTIVSDTSTIVDGHFSALVSPIHSAWTAVLNGASWIWGENPISDAVNDKTETFTRTFYLASVPASASITIAADNSYTASINGVEFASDSGEFNYTAAGQDTVSIPTANLHVGLNTLIFTVKNFAMSDGTMATNPAGLLYTLTVNGSTCSTPPAINVVASKVVCNDESLLPNWGLGGHSIGATTAADYVAAHPGCHLQSGWEFEWGNQNAGNTGDSFIGPAGNGYTTFGPTNASGTVSVAIPSAGVSELHLREVQQVGYIPFTNAANHGNSDDKSAEFYCTGDAHNYDNWDFIWNPHEGNTYYCVAFNALVTPVVSTSTVKMCKVDDQQHTLPNWTLMLKGAHVGSVPVNPDGIDHTLANVPAGNYVLTASGAYIYRPGDAAASTSDAAYSLRAPSDSVYAGPYAPWVRENNFPTPNTGWLGIMLNSSFTDWGSVFHPDHVYALGTTLASTSDMKFTILDDQYGDNSGSLNVDVDAGYVGVTGEDGCTTFQNVPYGTYSSSELNQAGWTNVSGTGSVTVDAPTETFTVVNHHVTSTEPTKYKVHIFKFLSTTNGETTTETQVPNDSTAPQFPMIATYAIAGVGTNLSPGDGYVLGNGGGAAGSDDGLKYAANTIPLSAGDTYGTHEVTDGSVVVSGPEACTTGKYYLKGYRVGTTLAAAKTAAISTTSPNFSSISGDEYVIVVNTACPTGGDNGGNNTHSTTTPTIVIKAENLATTTTDAVAHSDKWFFYNDATEAFDNTLGTFVTGPTGQPAGTGSAQIAIAPSGQVILATLGYGNTRFDKMTDLAYSTYRSVGDPALDLALQFGFDNDLTDSDTTYKGRMVYEPYLSQTVTPNTWQTWNPMDSHAGWWFSNGTIATASGCTQATPCTWAQIKTKYPNGGVAAGGSTLFKAGTWNSSSFTGNVDAFVIGVDAGATTTVTTYDFEPTAQQTTDTTIRRSSGRRSGGNVLGVSTTTEPQGKVLGASCGLLITDFLKLGWNNNADQVKALQTFLNGNLSLMLPVTGFFGTLTEQAVHAFQEKYSGDVLSPWISVPDSGIKDSNDSTGFVYKTTQWKINMINCPDLNLPAPQLP